MRNIAYGEVFNIGGIDGQGTKKSRQELDPSRGQGA